MLKSSSIVSYFVAVPGGEGAQLWMGRVALMGDVRGEDAPAGFERAFSAHAGERQVVLLASAHDSRTQVDEQLTIDQRSGALAQAWTARATGFLAVAARDGHIVGEGSRQTDQAVSLPCAEHKYRAAYSCRKLTGCCSLI